MCERANRIETEQTVLCRLLVFQTVSLPVSSRRNFGLTSATGHNKVTIVCVSFCFGFVLSPSFCSFCVSSSVSSGTVFFYRAAFSERKDQYSAVQLVLYFSNGYYLQNWTCPQVADSNLGGSCRN